MKKKNALNTFVQLLCAIALVAGLGQMAEAKKPKLAGVLNINTASIEQLKLLPRVGPKMARRIVTFRKKTPFKKPADIMKVRGIGKKTFAKMKPNITTKGKTNVRPAGTPPAKR